MGGPHGKGREAKLMLKGGTREQNKPLIPAKAGTQAELAFQTTLQESSPS
jgi:hypothetical protein